MPTPDSAGSPETTWVTDEDVRILGRGRATRCCDMARQVAPVRTWPAWSERSWPRPRLGVDPDHDDNRRLGRPVSGHHRRAAVGVGIGLMIGGIAPLGTVTAALASPPPTSVRAEEATTADSGRQLAALRQEVCFLRAALSRGTAA